MADAQSSRQFVERHDRGIAPAALQRTEVLLTESRLCRELLLRHAGSQSDSFHVLADQGAHIHAQQNSRLHSPSLSTLVCIGTTNAKSRFYGLFRVGGREILSRCNFLSKYGAKLANMIRGESDGDTIWSALHMVPENRQPAIQDEVPWDMTITDYDKAHFTCYVRLLDACAAGASDSEMCRIILSIDAAKEPDRARRALASHLKRARWMTEHGYRHLLQ